jgi:hypothetical protein
LEQVQRTDPAFVHAQDTDEEYARLFWTMYTKYLHLEPEQKANGEQIFLSLGLAFSLLIYFLVLLPI